ncbi:uncharacterized protein (UPF0303 family) [Kineococcus xinjiangensis]|uniref:UPF0303 protein CLV92_106139 n=1 Tax=Kineococcus xinjiangensis TaxID=512762 RepID=A0A2S6IM94_9ACTN|nr:heme-degrading domain-containing protein [Kineococcus xinjiangensis]PPK95318.1 uncharacterized protein (UPF0303 family) [Kineococcus xinjiangensis]
MTSEDDAWPTAEELQAQERELVWPAFGFEDAWRLGCALVEEGRRRELPIAVLVQRGGQRLFAAALPGSVPDNDAWLERKSRVVARFHRSSLAVGRLCAEAGLGLEEMFMVPEREFTAHGGAFPLTVAGTGVVGSVAVSGLPQLEDHALVVDVLRRQLAQ